MSAFGAALTGGAGCGTANPLLAMAGQMQGMGAQLADVRGAFVADKNAMPAHAPHTQIMHQQPGADPSSFLHAYQQKPAGPMPLHALQQAQAQRQLQHMAQQRMQQAHHGGELAEQFMQMELQAKQQHEFEQAFAHGARPAQHMPHGGAAWAQEFQQHEAQHRQHMAHARQANQGGAWASEFEQMQRMGPRAQMQQAHAPTHMPLGGMYNTSMMGGMYGMQRPMMGGMGGMMGAYAPQSHFGQQAASSSSSSVQIQEVPDATTAGPAEAETDELYGNAEHETLEEAYAAATGGQQWAQDYASQQQQESSAPQAGLGGGMDKDMLDALMKSDNPKWRNSKFLAFIDKISKGQIEFRGNEAIDKGPQAASQTSQQGDAWAGEFAAQQAASNGGASADWADQFAVQQNHPASWGSAGASSGGIEMSEAKSQAEQWLEDYEARGEADTEFKDFDWQSALTRARDEAAQEVRDPEYRFNEAAAQSAAAQSADPFADGVRLFKAGQLQEAILAFEAAVQRDPEHADAWSALGEAQAHNEEEHNAIAAFLKAVSIDPYNLKALLQLGVSYTNDLEESRALNYLKTWLQNNPDYQTAALAQHKQQVDEYQQIYDNTLHDDVTSLFLSALQQRPDDPDLHTVLGVLYHISSDFDKAIESFKRAVALKPDDAALWNKLGATQANSSRSSEAVHAYQRALQLRPTYVRTLANLAISYANQGLHEDAVRTYLTTLKHNPQANHVWSYLRISLAHMQRDDLVELSHKKDANLFTPFFPNI